MQLIVILVLSALTAAPSSDTAIAPPLFRSVPDSKTSAGVPLHTPRPGQPDTHGAAFSESNTLVWLSFLSGIGLVIYSLNPDSKQLQTPALVLGVTISALTMNKTLIPLIRSNFRTRKNTIRTLEQYEAKMRSLFNKKRLRNRKGKKTIRRHPEFHKKFLWTIQMLRDPNTESHEERAFFDWYLKLSQD